ncbi:hypothetical protein ASPZODRAFT_138042 [Penicilliopsis zonata CBS 506.65]|uniref:Major facilitator superfamily (MFS) profile domain-containing protein n=1 Tax=Penicilliopsis zonata CBS 506.65 TaxID=1073090 RepID=A0A1L9SV16_9EURO|nr:hypothetical protein ASPZODRAFT_138042 [Penicilliopsis zonata CBS 506.65]OJJ50917.1 hypothetical protein ASPZODRAFT_138042 [Penicilliopsis zonata CBS 506.65]
MDGEKVFQPRDEGKTSQDIEQEAWDTDNKVPFEQDSNIVDWDGPTDPLNPMEWAMSKKVTMIGIVSFLTFLTPLASSIFAPAAEEVLADFGSNSIYMESFIVSAYLLGNCFGPLVIAPWSELYGRSPVYHCCNVLFVLFNVACARAPNLGALLVFRILSGLAGGCPLTLGAGTIADLVRAEKRGGAMVSWVMGPLLGPVVGPIGSVGGYLSQAKGWRWCAWFLVIMSGFATVLTFLFLKETYAPIILEQKTQRLRKQMDNPHLRSKLQKDQMAKDLFKRSIVRPIRMLALSPIVFLLSLHISIIFGYIYLVLTTLSEVFEDTYGWSQGNVGLSYIGIGVGFLLGLFFTGVISDRLVDHLTAKASQGERKPEYRLPPMVIGSICVPIGLFLYGWTADTKQQWILPIIGTAFLAIGMVISLMTCTTYLVDAYPVYAASATAASTVFRSLVGALLPLAGNPMYAALGLGWGTSLLAFIALVMVPVPLFFYRYGEKIRKATKAEF